MEFLQWTSMITLYTTSVQEWIDCLQALRYVVLYLILAPYDNEQSDLIHRVKEDKNLEEIPVYK